MIWHALVVSPQTELRVRSKLTARGLRALAPTWLEEVERPGRKPALIQRVMLPGYVLAEFVAPPDWRDLHLIDGLRGFLHAAGDPDQPAALTRADIAAVEMMMRYRPRVASKPTVSVGDVVPLNKGTLSGVVIGLDEKRVTLLVDLFGRQNRVRLPLADIGDAA